MKKISLIFLLPLVLFISCKKNNTEAPSPRIEVNFSSDALAWVQLPQNRYFIYKDSASGSLDSVVVTQSNLETKYSPKFNSTDLFNPSRPEYHYQTFTLLLSKYSGTSQQDWFYGIADNSSLNVSISNPATPLYLRERDRVNNADKNYVFSYPVGNSSYGPTLSINLLSSLTIEGKNYLNVEVYMAANGLDPGQSYYRKTTYYWAKGIGIIKREIRTSTTIQTELLVRNG